MPVEKAKDPRGANADYSIITPKKVVRKIREKDTRPPPKKKKGVKIVYREGDVEPVKTTRVPLIELEEPMTAPDIEQILRRVGGGRSYEYLGRDPDTGEPIKGDPVTPSLRDLSWLPRPGGGQIDDLMALGVAGVVFYRANDTKYLIGQMADTISQFRGKITGGGFNYLDIAELVAAGPVGWGLLTLGEKILASKMHEDEVKEYKKDLKVWQTEHALWVKWNGKEAPVEPLPLNYQNWSGKDPADPSAEPDWPAYQKYWKNFDETKKQYEIDKHGWLNWHDKDEPVKPEVPPGLPFSDPKHSTVDEAFMMSAAAYFLVKDPRSIGEIIKGVGEIIKGIGEIVPG